MTTTPPSRWLLFLALLALSLLTFSAAQNTQYTAAFNQYCTQYGKHYSGTEYNTRLGYFSASMKFIANFDKSAHSYTVAINKFADWSPAELGVLATSSRPVVAPASSTLPVITHAPSSLDWRNSNAVTAVKDQGDCGSCWVFAAMGTAEGFYALDTQDLESFSEQYIMDCGQKTAPSSCAKGGYPLDALSYVKGSGVVSDDVYPYVGVDETCQSTKGGLYTIKEYGAIPYYDIDHEDESFMMDGLLRNPIACSLDANTTGWFLYHNGTYDAGDCTTDNSDHAITIVGYDTDASGTDYWIMKNSWNDDWGGLGGYIHVKRHHNPCGCTVGGFMAGIAPTGVHSSSTARG